MLSMAQYVWNINFQLSTSTPHPNPGSHMDLILDLMHQVLYSRLVYMYTLPFSKSGSSWKWRKWTKSTGYWIAILQGEGGGPGFHPVDHNTIDC